MKKSIVLLTALFVLVFFGTAIAASYTGPAIKAKLASEEIEDDFMTVWARNFSDHMKKWSGGKIDIEVYPYGTLGNTGDINELAQIEQLDERTAREGGEPHGAGNDQVDVGRERKVRRRKDEQPVGAKHGGRKEQVAHEHRTQKGVRRGGHQRESHVSHCCS